MSGTAHRVLVLGAGYAGMAAAVQLAARTRRNEGVRVTLVNAEERFTERMRLHMAATGQELAGFDIAGMLEGTGAGKPVVTGRPGPLACRPWDS
ncbi:FAD-binding protein [Actinomadura parmotrematis]|uniref:FAD-binding protein n=1 Tax=Actinomadura parmotrematis TaxID=2864039 RepID=A0ABS7FYK0_9ACTN|nr:FAD-binding protein [Actinomadura parmotrematis]MBW8485512.1 FAD-binding protein [Actinomadura parmotrematis]